MKINEKLKKQKGITLVALIITIIVLIIIATVTIKIFLDSGIIKLSIDSTQNYAKEAERENKIFDNIADRLEQVTQEINGGDPRAFTKEQLEEKVGKYVNYIPKLDTENGKGAYEVQAKYSGNSSSQNFITRDLKWRIWGVDGNELILVADGLTSSTLTLSGARGYNNAVAIINDLCNSCYSNTELKATSRGFNISDIESVLTWDPKTSSVNINGVNYNTYIGSKEWTGGKLTYPYIHSIEEYSNIDGTERGQGGGITRSEQPKTADGKYMYYEDTVDGAVAGYKTANSSIKPTRTTWSKFATSTDFKNSIYYDMIFKSGATSGNFVPYFLSSRNVEFEKDLDVPQFGINYVGSRKN